MKFRWILTISLVGVLSAQAHAGWAILNWLEAPPSTGPSATAGAEDEAQFLHVLAFNARSHNAASWQVIKESLREGDVIAYREEAGQARREIFLQGRFNKIPYRLFQYGHLAMVVKDPEDNNNLRLLSSWSFKCPNLSEDLDALKSHNWDSYRLNHWERVNKERFYEFIRVVRQKAEKWYGYDFSGLLGLWNSNLHPRKPQEIGHDYICSTVILAALHYGSVELDAYKRHGIGDIVTPLQLVSSKGRLAPVSAEDDRLFGEQD